MCQSCRNKDVPDWEILWLSKELIHKKTYRSFVAYGTSTPPTFLYSFTDPFLYV
jgi:hypothetical protein